MSYFVKNDIKKFIVINNERYCIEYLNGAKYWYLNGQLHRENGPAVIDGNYQAWWFNGQLHREDGPAVIDGDCQMWWLNGIKYSKEEYYKKLKELL